MSLQYIIDGYNLIHHPLFLRSSPNKEDVRVSFLSYLLRERPYGSPKNKVTVVFDGFPASTGAVMDTAFNVLFSRKISADELIKKLVEQSGNRKTLIVVSDDREIQYIVRSLGAKVLGAEEFLSAKDKCQRGRESPETGLNYTQMQEIDKELRKLWKIS